MISVLYEDNHLLVVKKPCNIATCEDSSKDKDLLTECKEYLKVKYNKPGNVYCGLVHRLDRPVGGIIVFAKTSKAASRLSDQVRTHVFKKTYYAVIDGKTKQRETLKDKLLKDTKTNMVKVDPKGKDAILHYEKIAEINNLTLVRIQLETGRSHQIRVQFASRNMPLFGDQRYNKKAKVGQQIALWATELEIEHPTTKEKMTFTCKPDSRYPFDLFEKGGSL